MASNQLNAGAASFTPGGPPTATSMQDSFTEASFNEYTEMVDNIEQEMEADALDESYDDSPPAGISGLPAHMVKHANEFWFPESRNCACCNGFKHGCKCAASNRGTCASCSSSPPSQPSQGSMKHSAPPQQGHNAGQQQICKFFSSPGGCRFGDSCRFLHA